MLNLSHLPDAEQEVMQAQSALDRYPAHTADIAQKLSRDWKAPTLIKLLSRLEERGFVEARKEGRVNVYTPKVLREDYLAAESRSFLNRLHGGSLSSLVAALAPETKLTSEDVKALEALLKKGGD